jgi:hypothetical protein
MNVRLQYPVTFTAGIHYNNQLQMNNYSLKLFMITNTEDGVSSNIAFDRIKHFIYNELDSSVIIDSIETEQIKLYLAAGVNLITLPAEPVDQLVGIMLQHKLNAIADGRLIVVEIEISSTIGDGLVYTYGEGEDVSDLDIPDWWKSSGLIHHDSNLIDTDNVLSIHQNNVWHELDLAWPNDTDSEPTGNTVVFADFKKTDETK